MTRMCSACSSASDKRTSSTRIASAIPSVANRAAMLAARFIPAGVDLMMLPGPLCRSIASNGRIIEPGPSRRQEDLDEAGPALLELLDPVRTGQDCPHACRDSAHRRAGGPVLVHCDGSLLPDGGGGLGRLAHARGLHNAGLPGRQDRPDDA